MLLLTSGCVSTAPCDNPRYITLRDRADSLTIVERHELDSLSLQCEEALGSDGTNTAVSIGGVVVLLLVAAVIFLGEIDIGAH